MKTNAFENFGKMMVRTPLFSHDILFDKNNNTKNIDELIYEFLDNERFLESIYWSSIPLYETIINLKNKELPDVKRKKLFITLKKYLIRSSTRPTPYGTFAGTAIQNLSENNNEEIGFMGKKIRLDVSIIRKIIRSIKSNKAFSSYISYTINNTLYLIDNQYRYLEVDTKGEESTKISVLEKNEILNFIYLKGKKNKINFDDVFNNFSEYFNEDEFRDFFDELVEAGFLVSELELDQTGGDDLKYVREFIERDDVKNIDETSIYINLLNAILDYISVTKTLPSGDFNKKKYDHILYLLGELKIFLTQEQIFQVDVLNQNNDSLVLSNKNLKNLYEAFSVLSKITMRESSQSSLQKFQSIFSEKYNTAAVPLLEVLDPEIGIGFPANINIGNFSENNFISFPSKNIQDTFGNKHNISDWLINKIESLSPEESEIKIEKSDLEDILERTSLLSNTFNVVGQLVSFDKILLKSVGGTHANTLLSRFAYMKKDIQTLCSDITHYEQQASKEAIFAEIVWIPEKREANITRRISYTDYEVPIYYKSSLPDKNQIALNDILVSVENEEIILTSKKLKRRIIPRLSSAYNYLLSDNSVYKFLCSLQSQKSINLILMPDFINSKKRFFPRITYKNIILHQSSWILQESDIRLIRASPTPVNELKLFLKKWKVAKFVLLCQGDNELFLDISNDSYLDILLAEIDKNYKIIILKEWLYDFDNNYVNEFILPLKKTQPISYKNLTFKNNNKDIRSIYPGGEWLYFKLYCDANYSDAIIKTVFSGAIKKLEKSDIVEKWFFVRYLDPHYHIRLRIKIKTMDATGEVMNLINKNLNSFTKKNTIWKINVDTYNRELERYLPSEIDHAEYAFYKDSYLYVKLLDNTDFRENLNLKLFAAIKNINFWLDLFNLDLKAKINFCETMKEAFAHEQSKDFLQETENKYREYKDSLFDFMRSNVFDNHLKKRNRDLRKINLNMKNLQEFTHMSINRWFITNQRNWEFLIYYFCLKYYNRILYSFPPQNIDK